MGNTPSGVRINRPTTPILTSVLVSEALAAKQRTIASKTGFEPRAGFG
jgi:hypothetical protein